MKLSKYKNHILILILLLSLFVRFYKLGSLPETLNRDEAALAYNAYLLKETGRDEWNRSWPISLESFGDWKLPGYIMTLIPLFSVFGLSDFVVKIPSAIAGTFLVYISYLIARKLNWSTFHSLGVSIIVGTMPVFFFYSRIAFEANLALTLLVTSLYLLLKNEAKVKKRLLTDFLAAIIWLFAILTYNTPLLLMPFLLPIIIFSRGIKNYKKWIFPIGLLSFFFLMIFFQQLSLSAQKSSITIFSDETYKFLSAEHYNSYSGVSQKLFGNKYFFYLTVIMKNLYKSFTPNFLVTNGGQHPWHQLPGFGHMLSVVYLAGIGGFIYSIVEIIKKVISQGFSLKIFKDQSTSFLILYLLLVSLAPSVVTVDSPHATRSLLFFYVFSFSAIYFLKILKIKYALIFFAAVLVLFANYFSSYFSQYPDYQAKILQTGYEEIITDVSKTSPAPTAVIDPGGYQYILTAWYLKIDPNTFHETIVRQQPNSYGFRYGERLERYHFIVDIDDRTNEEETLINWSGAGWEVIKY